MPSSSSSNGDKEADAGAVRASGARSDFLSHLDRRIGELRGYLKGLEQEPGSPRLRDDLRRRVHALSTGARHLRLTGMAAALAEVERLLERAAAVGGLERAELAVIGARLDELPKLAESAHEHSPSEYPASAETLTPKGVPPSVLVVGPSGLADAIANPLEHGLDADIECERTESAAAAIELVRSLAPDVAVIDTDLPGAKELVTKLTRDALVDPLPIVVVGTWSSVEDGARWVAAGASRAMPKPISPHGLRKACLEVRLAGPPAMHFAPMGHATVDELTARIVSEVKRGLEDAVVSGKATSVLLGDGSDILAAVWGALARVRDLVMLKSGGHVRFSAQGPEGALPIAPWGGEGSGVTESPGGQRGPDSRRDESVSLGGRKVVVADDDPAVTWFIGGVLRAVGADVREAHDGKRALEVCFRFSPELVISDVLMPGLDGFALCRALKRDIALRDVPVILLSWKEDLLQRLRDLGADADGYLRKEASAAAILERVRQVLWERARLEARLKSEGEVRGRLDGVTPRTLLDAVARLRPDGRVRIRDASYLYEIEIRGGAPKSATRTTSDGSFQRGKPVFAALLGVRSGRYVVSRAEAAVRGTLEGDLEAQMEEPLARARAALSLLGGARLLEVHRVEIAREQVEPYLEATPEPARSLVVRLAEAASPRDLVLRGEVAPAELDQVLGDLAGHGAIVAIRGANDVDLLGPAFARELAIIRREGPPSVPVKAAAPPVMPPITIAPDEPETNGVGEPIPDDDEEAPSSLEAAVIRQLSEPTPLPGRVGLADEDRSIVDTSELKARAVIAIAASDRPIAEPSLPPDAIIPGSASDERIQVAAPPHVAFEEHERVPHDSAPAAAAATGASPTARAGAPVAPPRAPHSDNSEIADALSLAPPPKQSASFALAALVALATIAVLVAVLRYGSLGSPPSARIELVPKASPVAAPGGAIAPAEATTPAILAAPAASAAVAASAAPSAGEEGPLPRGVAVGTGQGLLDVETSDHVSVFVDGVELGRGPFLRLTLAAGAHEVRLRGSPETSGTAEARGATLDRVHQVNIHAARRTRLLVLPSWTR